MYIYIFLSTNQVPDNHPPVHAASLDQVHHLHDPGPGPGRAGRHGPVSQQLDNYITCEESL